MHRILKLNPEFNKSSNIVYYLTKGFKINLVRKENEHLYIHSLTTKCHKGMKF